MLVATYILVNLIFQAGLEIIGLGIELFLHLHTSTGPELG